MLHLYIVMGMLAAGVVIKTTAPLLKHGNATDKRLAITLSCALPLAALALYLALGNPDLAGRPAVLEDPLGMVEREAALMAERPLRTLLEENPEDIGALIKLGVLYMRLNNYSEATKFYAKAVELAQQTGDANLRIYARGLGRAQVKANKGFVGDNAAETFQFVLTLHANEPIARYYLALRLAQQGKTEAALAEWSSMLGEGTPLAYWKQYVRDAMAAARAGTIAKADLNLP
ncbi:MAG: tetratricopeptide repeat protein [Alphaproteobacteria bacterium]